MTFHPQHDFDRTRNLRGTDSLKWNTYPEDVIPMWIADSDFRCPQPVLDALTSRINAGSFGYPRITTHFAEAVRHWMGTRFDWRIEPEWVLFAHAIVPGLVDAIQTFTAPGDAVLIQQPVYPPFHECIVQNGRVKRVNALKEDAHGVWRMDLPDLYRQLADPAVKLMFLCHPHNPVGRVFTPDELVAVGEACADNGVVLVSDEIHGDFVYPPLHHVPMPSLSPLIAANTLVFVNPSKTFNIPGMHAAAAIVPNPTLRARLASTIQARRSAEPTSLGLVALETAYTQCAWYADQAKAYIEGNIAFALDFFARDIPRIKVTRPEATFLLWLDCRALSLTPDELHAFMLKKAKVAMNDGGVFGQEGAGFMRMNMACTRATLTEALQRIQTAVKML
ncbi:MAG: MalY/PatB family protein [Bilophila sp.]